MKDKLARHDKDLGPLLESFVNRVSHTKGRAMEFMLASAVTSGQAILLNTALLHTDCTPTDLAASMRLSLSSVSQMIERLVKLELVTRNEAAGDRRRKSITVTANGRTFLDQLKAIRIEEYAEGTAGLSTATRHSLTAAIRQALAELET